MRRWIIFTAALSFVFLSAADARTIRGYDTVHHASAIVGIYAPESGRREIKLYFHKIFSADAPLFKLSALDRRHRDILANGTLTLVTDDRVSYVFAPEEKVLRFRPGVFFEVETSVKEIVLSPEAVAAIASAEKVSLAFASEGGSVYDCTLTKTALREWKEIIAAEK